MGNESDAASQVWSSRMLAAVDSDTRAYLQQAVARECDLPSRLASRLAGEDIGSLRADAQALRTSLGITQEGRAARDDGGRFTGDSMSDMIRRAAGR